MFTIGMVRISVIASKTGQLFNPTKLRKGMLKTFMVKCTGKTANELTLYHKTTSFITDILSNNWYKYLARIKHSMVPDMAQMIIKGKSLY